MIGLRQGMIPLPNFFVKKSLHNLEFQKNLRTFVPAKYIRCMQTYKLYANNPNPRILQDIAQVVREGGIVIYPTDSVYAIGCDALNQRAVEKIYQYPRRNRRTDISRSSAATSPRLPNTCVSPTVSSSSCARTFLVPSRSSWRRARSCQRCSAAATP